MIRLHEVSRSYAIGGGLTVLRQVSLEIARGESVCIVGPSGSGKSTLLHLMGLLDRPSRGAVYIDGQDTTFLSDEDLSHLRGRRIGFVFQAFHLIAHLSVRENVELPLLYQRVPPAERRDRALACLEQVGLLARERHRANQLSGGERQRTAIARALVTDPELILADEPTGNLDSRTGAEILAALERMRAQGRTVVAITHDALVAARFPRVIRIIDGEVQGGPGA